MAETITKLHNGVTVIYSPKECGLTDFSFFYTVGSFNETDSTRGISHLIEHLMFNCCPTMTSMEFNTKMDSLGASVNAYTSTEFTRYYFSCLKESFKDCFNLYKELIESFTVTQEALDKEIPIILSELAMCKDDNSYCVKEELFSNIYRVHPISNPVIGYENVLKSITTEDVQRYYDKHYVPDGLYAVISGDVSESDMEYVLSALGDIPFRAESPGRIVITDKLRQPMLKSSTRYKDTNQTLIRGAIYAGNNIRAMWLTSILSTILGGTMSSFLWNEFREKRSLAYSISSSYAAFDPEMILLSFGTGLNENSDTDLAIDLFKEALVYAKNIPVEEFNKAYKSLKTSILMNTQTIGELSFYVTDYIYYNLDPPTYDSYISDFKSITFEEFSEFAKSFDPNNLVTALLVPDSVKE